MSAASFDEGLEVTGFEEIPWGEPPLLADTIRENFHRLARNLQQEDPPAAICIASFMHSFMVGGEFQTWMSFAPPDGIAAIRKSIGPDFHQRTGCHYHPMFPVFKLASMTIQPTQRIVSPKGLLIAELTESFIDDYGMGAATGMLNIHSAAWDQQILAATRLVPENLPQLADPDAIVGKNRNGSMIVNGSGDGFMANIGSGCEQSNRIAITMGTSAAVRQMVSVPVLDPAAGTFCYRANLRDAFLLGCASSNGGNALDWARRAFDVSVPELRPRRNIPIFMPWLNGERSLEWNPELKPAWHGREPSHTPAELFRAVMEGVVFNLAQYVEVIEKASGLRAEQFVLSGNGFLDPAVAPMLAALLSRETLQPQDAGLGTLRGAAVTAWRALGHDAAPAIERMLLRTERVKPMADEFLHDRFLRFKQLRKNKGTDT